MVYISSTVLSEVKMFSDQEMAVITAVAGFATGFAIEYGRADALRMYRSLLLLFGLFVAVALVTGNVWEFAIIVLPFITMHALARWLFGPLKR